MSDWNSTESRLRGWTPRQPSPELRKSIFGREVIRATPHGTAQELVRWLVPALGCFLLASATMTDQLPSSEALHLAATNRILASESAGAWEEYSELAYSRRSRDHHSDINSVPRRNVEWVVGSRAAASQPTTFVISETNTLIQ